MDADSALANVLEVLVPVIAGLVVAVPLVIAVLKRRWLGPIAAVAGLGAGAVVFTVEPSVEFQETVVFWIVEKLLNIAVVAGVAFVLLSAIRPARAGSWWDRRGAIIDNPPAED